MLIAIEDSASTQPLSRAAARAINVVFMRSSLVDHEQRYDSGDRACHHHEEAIPSDAIFGTDLMLVRLIQRLLLKFQALLRLMLQVVQVCCVHGRRLRDIDGIGCHSVDRQHYDECAMIRVFITSTFLR